jgi:hypothetical protein
MAMTGAGDVVGLTGLFRAGAVAEGPVVLPNHRRCQIRRRAGVAHRGPRQAPPTGAGDPARRRSARRRSGIGPVGAMPANPWRGAGRAGRASRDLRGGMKRARIVAASSLTGCTRERLAAGGWRGHPEPVGSGSVKVAQVLDRRPLAHAADDACDRPGAAAVRIRVLARVVTRTA